MAEQHKAGEQTEQQAGGSTPQQSWDENVSALFIDLGPLFVPARMEQTVILRHLVPAPLDEPFSIAELAAGDGMLARSLLAAFPLCHYLALDGSEAMRERLRQTLGPFGERVEVRDFDIRSRDWRDTLPKRLRCIVSSLCVHHLDSQGKRQLFADMAARLEPGGAFLTSGYRGAKQPDRGQSLR